MNKRLIGAGALAVALGGSLIAPVAAAPGSVTGDIELASSGVELARVAAPSYGSTVAFKSAVEGRLDPKGYIYVNVVCLQGSTVVYQWSAAPDFEFPLVDQAGQGLEWDGDAANCISSLVYRIDGRKPTIQYLDKVEFQVSSAQTA